MNIQFSVNMIPLSRDFLLVGLPELHFPNLAFVFDTREDLQGLGRVIVEKRRHWRVF